VQNDFADPAGSLYVTGGQQVPAAVNDEIAAAIDAGGAVVYTQDWHPPATPHFAQDGGVWPVHCVAGTWGAQLHPELAVVGPTVRKGTSGEDGYSGFTVQNPRSGERAGTGLEDLLRARNISTVVVAGLATDYCVKETALDAVAKGFATVVLSGAIRAVDLAPGDGDRALAAMVEVGVRLVSAL
jgi:nicotinamidase/pyrazinamidase